MSMMRKTFAATAKALGDRQVETIASTESPDREKDRILSSAWRLDAYRRNPVVLFAHDYGALPPARSRDVRVVGGALRTVDEFPPPGVYPFADTLYELIKAGFVTSKSVSFQPLTWRPNDEGGRDYTDVELLEHSYVTVPANPEALVVARSKGLDRTRLDLFLRGATRDLDVTKADVLAALRQAIPDLVERGIGQAVAPLWARVPASAEVLILDDEAERGLSPADMRAALGSLAELAAAEVNRVLPAVLNAARGRVD